MDNVLLLVLAAGCSGAALRRLDHPLRAQPQRRQCAHAGNRPGDSGRRRRLSEPPVHHHRHGRRGDLRSRAPVPRLAGRRRLPDRRRAVRPRRLCRHVRLGARQCPHRRSLAPGSRPGLSVAFRSGAVTGMLVVGLGVLAVAGYYAVLTPASASTSRSPNRAASWSTAWSALGFGRLADLDLRPSRRRHLHQGRRRRRRHGRQGRSRHPRGRPAQPGHHRRQRGRQCRRLRRHGGRPVRDLRGDHRRHHGAGLDLFHRRAQIGADALSPRHRGHEHRDLDRRHLLRPPRRLQEHHGRALQGRDRHRRPCR